MTLPCFVTGWGKPLKLGFKLWILGVIMAEIHLCLQDCRTQHDSTHDLMVVVKKSRCNPQKLKCLQRKDGYGYVWLKISNPEIRRLYTVHGCVYYLILVGYP